MVDLELRQAERDAARDGDHQRLYVLLERAGRHDEARALFLDHPIRVEAVVRYRYVVFLTTGNYNDFQATNELASYDLENILQQVANTKVGVSQILSVHRQAVYQILGQDIILDYATRGPLKAIVFTQEELQAFKAQVRSHSSYMQGATAEQLREEQEAAQLDTERAQRKREAEQRSIEASQRRLQAEEKFQNNSLTQVEEVWDLWCQHHMLARPQFAIAISHHPMRFALFYLKDKQASGMAIIRVDLDEIWKNNEFKRRQLYHKNLSPTVTDSPTGW